MPRGVVMRSSTAGLTASAAFLAPLAPLARGGDYTALDRYVAAPDPSFRYSLANTVNVPGLAVYQLDMVSQTWLTSADVDRPEWRHWVTIYKPGQLTTSTVFLFIDGGDNSSSPAPPNFIRSSASSATGAILARAPPL